jgi:hypothetical protein
VYTQTAISIGPERKKDDIRRIFTRPGGDKSVHLFRWNRCGFLPSLRCAVQYIKMKQGEGSAPLHYCTYPNKSTQKK